jgi:acetyl esterase/lipase
MTPAIPDDDILEKTPPPADVRLTYGSDPSQFGDLRLPKTSKPSPVVMNIHGGFWRAKYGLAHAGHLCAALTQNGVATWNLEYRRVGDPGGGWPGTFEDIVNGYRFLSQIAKRYNFDLERTLVMGHSAGGQLAICLAAHESTVQRVISLAGVLDLQEAYRLHLSHDAVAEFLGGTPTAMIDHYREADPMALKIATARQIVVHGAIDDTVPLSFSQNYEKEKRKRGEKVELLEIAKAGHYELIDPRTPAFAQVRDAVSRLLASA